MAFGSRWRNMMRHATEAEADGGHGIVAAFQDQHLRADQPRIGDPADQRHGDVEAAEARPEDGDDRQHQHQERERPG